MSQGHNLTQGPNKVWEQSAKTVIEEFGDKSVAGDTFMEILMEALQQGAVRQTQGIFNEILSQINTSHNANIPGGGGGHGSSIDSSRTSPLMTPDIQKEILNRMKGHHGKK